MAQEPKGVPCHLLVQMEADDDIMRSVTNCSLWLRQKLVAPEGVSTYCHLLALLSSICHKHLTTSVRL